MVRDNIIGNDTMKKETNDNNPAIKTDLFRFPLDTDGNPSTFAFQNGIPYLEVSAGVSNVFKILRIEFLQRLTYLDNPSIPTMFGVKGLGLRAKGKIDF